MTDRMSIEEYRALQASEKVHKWRNKPVLRDGEWYQSTGEADRHGQLLILQRAGEISDLERQKPFELRIDGQLIKTYRADFVYFDHKTKQTIVEDFKGCETREFILTKKLMLALYGIEILVTRRPDKKSGRKNQQKGKQLWKLKPKKRK